MEAVYLHHPKTLLDGSVHVFDKTAEVGKLLEGWPEYGALLDGGRLH